MNVHEASKTASVPTLCTVSFWNIFKPCQSKNSGASSAKVVTYSFPSSPVKTILIASLVSILDSRLTR